LQASRFNGTGKNGSQEEQNQMLSLNDMK